MPAIHAPETNACRELSLGILRAVGHFEERVLRAAQGKLRVLKLDRGPQRRKSFGASGLPFPPGAEGFNQSFKGLRG